MKFKARTDTQSQRAQRVDYNRIKHERAQEINNQQQNKNSINSDLHKYVYPFHYQTENNNGTIYFLPNNLL
jgi:hypothetical protein